MTVSYLLATFTTLVALIFAITSREAGRGMIAAWFGDQTARAEKRLTFNPFVHLDPLGTVLLPAIFLIMHSPLIVGWAKPLHLNYSQLRPYKLGNVVVHLSGPLIHIFLAWVSVLLIHLNPHAHTLGNEILIKSFQVNLMLAAFNLLPLPPLDGGSLIAALLPPVWANSFLKIEPYTPLIILLLILLPGALATVGINFNPLFSAIMPLLSLLERFVLFLSGHI